ncbi:MAG: hypothetical protein WDN45_01760 [Caulobacteraceae bacterium]
MLAATSAAAQGCSRDALLDTADDYVDAQEAGMPLKVHMGLWADYNEQMVQSTMSTGVISKPMKVDFYRVLADTTSCNVFIETRITDPAHPYVIGAIVSQRGGDVNSFQVVYTDKVNGWLFSPANTASTPRARTGARSRRRTATAARPCWRPPTPTSTCSTTRTSSAVGRAVRAPGRRGSTQQVRAGAAARADRTAAMWGRAQRREDRRSHLCGRPGAGRRIGALALRLQRLAGLPHVPDRARQDQVRAHDHRLQGVQLRPEADAGNPGPAERQIACIQPVANGAAQP